jgi:ABC-type bacteriocin/lantibiotic exporter with double-glycine peptidase domain
LTWARDLVRLAGWFPVLSGSAAAFSLAAALLEGVGLAALIPVINASLGAAPEAAGLLKFWLPADPESWILIGIVSFLVLAVAASVSRFLADILLLRLRSAIERKARERLTHALLRMSWPAFLSLRTGDLTQAQFTEGLQMGTGAQLLVQAIGASLASLAYLSVAFAISPSMTLYTGAFGLLMASLYAVFGRWARHHVDALSGIASAIGDRLTEMFQALKFIRATGMSPRAEAQTGALYDDWKRTYFASQLYSIGLRNGFEILGLVFIAAFLLLSARTGSDGLAAALVFLGIFYRLAPRLLAVQDGLYQARACHPWYLAWMGRLSGAEGARASHFGSEAPRLRIGIELRNVTFTYPGAARPAIKDCTLRLPANRATAIVGASGSGKTTLLDLLTGLLEPSTGGLFVDDTDLRNIDVQAWRLKIGLVQQEPLLVHGTLLENIAWGDPSPDAARARDAADRAGLSAVLAELPHGMDTTLGERGGRLSGGQRQRVTIARALYRQPTLLILDEPTSALDQESQREVLTTLQSIKDQCTMVVVTHSAQVSALCDHVATLADGGVVSVRRQTEDVA